MELDRKDLLKLGGDLTFTIFPISPGDTLKF
jgi:hypothetical protein